MKTQPIIVWFRHDLRVSDNPALSAAAAAGPVIPVFIWSPEEEGNWSPGSASRWWLHQSLASLKTDLMRLGTRLILRRGPTLGALESLAAESGATAVYWNRRYEPATIRRDATLQKQLSASGLSTRDFNGSLLYEPHTISTKNGRPFQVFTPFWKTCLAGNAPETPLCTPRTLQNPLEWPAGIDLETLALEPPSDSTSGLRATWVPGSEEAKKRLEHFRTTSYSSYADKRDQIAAENLSRLSPHLHFGEISPRQIWWALYKMHAQPKTYRHDPFLRQLGWREFAHHLLFHFPHTPDQPLRTPFANFGWIRDQDSLSLWQRGETGVPLVDAAMRQLGHQGWMPNRARMIVASYLSKNLLISWREGAAFFWDSLVDADLANNTLGWQWTAGCGADAAPFFRIFNPVIQAEKFDPQGHYIRHWITELRHIDTPWIFKPWEAPSAIRKEITYPEPLVDLQFSRQRALRTYQQLSKAGS